MWSHLTDPPDPAHVARVVTALDAAPARCGAVRVVTIDGPSGSGKTTLARGVGEALGAPVVHMDRIYPGWDGLAESVGLLVEQVLGPVARGEAAAYRVWDWDRGGWRGSKSVPRTGVLVVEGCGSSVGPAGECAAVRVWLEAPRDERRRRGLARDGEAYRPHWEQWAAQEDSLYARDGTRAKADLVIATG
ncbi:MAG: AAA family ATPase [Dermatophilaceae bacterium]